jgi:hypothetical protein
MIIRTLPLSGHELVVGDNCEGKLRRVCRDLDRKRRTRACSPERSYDDLERHSLITTKIASTIL